MAKPKKPTMGGINRVEDGKSEKALFEDDLKETLVEAETASSGTTEEMDADTRMESIEEGEEAPGKKKGGKKK